MENKRQNIDLGDIFSKHAEGFLKKHKLCNDQLKAFEAIIQCRTLALGGHLDCCDQCGHTRQSYNSCRNRHCPKCQFIKQEQWVDKLAGNLPRVKHFHLVFTIPSCLNKLFYINQEITYSLLFKAAGDTLIQCARNPKYIGVQTGAVAILHTWGQTLVYHPHIHMIVPAGGLSEDQSEWIGTGKNFFLPVKVLSAVFRGILCKLLEQAFYNEDLELPKDTIDFISIKKLCYKKKWVVYSEKPFSSSENLIRYLGNYTHRVAISNSRLLEHQDNKVSFSYKDYKSGGLKRKITLGAEEFIRRFLQHVLPTGFCKIRYFGFMALCNIGSKIELIEDLIGNQNYIPIFQGLSVMEVWREITGNDPLVCPRCKTGKMRTKGATFTNVLKPG